MAIRLACIAAALACAGVAHAAPFIDKALTTEEVKANKVRIEEQFDHAQTRCRRVQGHARELCNEQARGERDVQQAELQLRAEPTVDNDQKLRLAKAEASYSRALVQCKVMEGQARSVCRQDARMVFTEAKNEARLQKEVADQQLRADNTVRQRSDREEKVAQAEFNAARTRCEMLPGDGRENCLADLKKRFDR